MKTERVTLLTSPEFKAFLGAEALREGVSVGELVRRRCEGRPSADEAALTGLTAELRTAVREAKKSLTSALEEAHSILGALQQGRAAHLIAAEPEAVYQVRKSPSRKAAR